jgi:GH15 family glucan-1,4-alpha-glucosidase
MDALYFARESGLSENPNVWRIQNALVSFLESDWRKPDEGIWEVRGPSRQFTHSKVMAWVAADRAVKSVERFGLPGPVDRWRRLRQTIHDEVCREGFNQSRNSFVQSYGSSELDASLLMMPLVGFLPIEDPRIQGTIRAIENGLVRGGFVQRYEPRPELDGLASDEGTFLLCTFWLVDCLTLSDRHDDALKLFERLLSLRNDVGLLSEQYDPVAGRLMGNFPQAFSHIGLINSARNLTSRHGGAAERRQQR